MSSLQRQMLIIHHVVNMATSTPLSDRENATVIERSRNCQLMTSATLSHNENSSVVEGVETNNMKNITFWQKNKLYKHNPLLQEQTYAPKDKFNFVNVEESTICLCREL